MRLLRDGATVSALTLAGRVLGFVRTVLIAAWLGAGPAADAFLVAFRLFGALRAALAGGGIGNALVPMFSRRLSRQGPERARRFARDAFASMLVATAAVTGLSALAMPFIVRAVSPGFAASPEQLGLAVSFARMMAPCLLLGALALVLRAVLDGLHRFAAGAAMPVLFNLAVIGSLVTLGSVLKSPAHALSLGVAAAGALQLAVLVYACRRAGFTVPLVAPRLSPAVRRLFRRAAIAAMGAGAVPATLLVDLGVASLLPSGAVSHLDYAARVTGLVPALVGGAAVTVLLPVLSRTDGRGRDNVTNRTLEAVMLLGLPGAVALAVIPGPLAAALFQHGAFTGADAAATAGAMAAYAAGLPAWIGIATLAAVFHARGDTATPTGVAAAGVAANLLLSLLLAGPLGHTGIALGTAVSVWLQAVVLLGLLLHRRTFAPDRRLGVRVMAMAVSSAAMAWVLWLAREALARADLAGADLASAASGVPAGPAERAVALAVLVAVGLVAFMLFALLTGAVRPRELAAAWAGERR